MASGRPIWERGGDIGDVDGDTEKHDCRTEETPYAAMILRDLRNQRGTAYTQADGTLVDVENVALARFFSAVFYRTPEKFRANALPGRSDERLGYWRELLAVPVKPGTPARIIRKKLAVHYEAPVGSSTEEVQRALQGLLGDAFVSFSAAKGGDLANPPTETYWPGVNPGSSDFSLGGGAWYSERCKLVVQVTQPAGMSESDFQQLLNVEAFALLDRMLPAWATAEWELV